MPPPVSPVSSLFQTGISVDSSNPFSIQGQQLNVPSTDRMVMPDAMPGGMEHRRTTNRKSRHTHDHGYPMSQGYLHRLEPVLEQSGSEPFSEPLYNARNLEANSSSSDEMRSESTQLLVFPSANKTPEYSALELSARTEGKRRKSTGSRREHIVDWGTEGTVFYNGSSRSLQNGFKQGEVDLPVKLTREEPGYSPRSEAKFRRDLARDQELSKQKALMKKKLEEEERRKILQQEQRAAKIAQEYKLSRSREMGLLPPRSRRDPGQVIQEAAKYDAKVQVIAELTPNSPAIQRATQYGSPQHSRQSSADRRPSREEIEPLQLFDQNHQITML